VPRLRDFRAAPCAAERRAALLGVPAARSLRDACETPARRTTAGCGRGRCAQRQRPTALLR
jgi:hypothetical protein